MYTDQHLQAINLRLLLRTGAFRFADDATPWFPYTSGQIGPYYVQSITVESDGEAYATAVESMATMIRDWAPEYDVISGGETRDWDFSNPCAVLLRKPHLKIYKDGRMLGADIRGKRVLHVADLNNEGSSMRDCWHPAISAQGGRPVGMIAYVDRLEEGVDVLQRLQLPAAAVVPLDDRAWQIALEDGCVTPGLHAALTERRRDRDGWALRQIQADPRPLRRMLAARSTRDKALKIIAYYRGLCPDLESILTEPSHEN